MNHEYIHTFRWLRDDYTRLRDGTELLDRINECYADTDCGSPGSRADQRRLNSLRNCPYPNDLDLPGSGENICSYSTVSLNQDLLRECPESGTAQDEPRRPRKGHKKSRRGCYNCKKRKVKVCFHNHLFHTISPNIASAKKPYHHVRIVHGMIFPAATPPSLLQVYP